MCGIAGILHFGQDRASPDLVSRMIGMIRHHGLTPGQVTHIYRDIASKRRATHYLHLQPLLVNQIPEITLGARAACKPKTVEAIPHSAITRDPLGGRRAER